jgi:hypothetical protein
MEDSHDLNTVARRPIDHDVGMHDGKPNSIAKARLGAPESGKAAIRSNVALNRSK